MRVWRREVWWAVLLVAGLGIGTSTPCPAQAQSAPTTTAVAPSSDARFIFSPGIRDVLKMVDAKVDPTVIAAYIKNSPIPFNPSAAEIIALKQRGVPDDLLTVMLQHGAEVRAQLAQSAATPSAPLAQPPTATSTPYYGYDYSAAPYYSDYSTYPYTYPYFGYPYSYGYGYPYSYWWYNNYYPFYSPFYFGFGFHNHFHDFDHFRHFDGHRFGGYHGNGSYAFHGRNGTGPWAPVSPGFRSGFRGVQNRGFVSAGFRSGGFAGHSGGFAMHSGGGFRGGGGGFGGHAGGGGHGGGHR